MNVYVSSPSDNSGNVPTSSTANVSTVVNVSPKKFISVPNGWNRRVTNQKAVYYISPSGHVLLSKSDVYSYLEQKHTCKCYLNQALRYEDVFDFNPEVVTHMVPVRYEQTPSQCEEWAQSISEVIHCQMLLTLDHLVSLEVHDIYEVYKIVNGPRFIQGKNVNDPVPLFDQWLDTFEWDQIRVTRCGRKILQNLDNDRLRHLTYELTTSGEMTKTRTEISAATSTPAITNPLNSIEAKKNMGININCDITSNAVCYANTPEKSSIKSPLINSHQSPIRVYGNHVNNHTLPSPTSAEVNSNALNHNNHQPSAKTKTPSRRRQSASTNKSSKTTISPSSTSTTQTVTSGSMSSVPPLIPASTVSQVNLTLTPPKATAQPTVIPINTTPTTSPSKQPVSTSQMKLLLLTPPSGLNASSGVKLININFEQFQNMTSNTASSSSGTGNQVRGIQFDKDTLQQLCKQGKVVFANQTTSEIQFNAQRQVNITKTNINNIQTQTSTTVNTNGQAAATPKRKRNTPSTRKSSKKVDQSVEDATRDAELEAAAELKKQNLLAKSKLLYNILDKPRLTKQEDSGNRSVKLPRFESFKTSLANSSSISDDSTESSRPMTYNSPDRIRNFRYIHIVKQEQVLPPVELSSPQQTQLQSQPQSNNHQLPEHPANYIDYQLPQQEVHYSIDDNLTLPNENVLRLPMPQSPPPASIKLSTAIQSQKQSQILGHDQIVLSVSLSEMQQTTNNNNLNHVLVNDKYDPFMSQHSSSSLNESNSLKLTPNSATHLKHETTLQIIDDILPTGFGDVKVSSHNNLPGVSHYDEALPFDSEEQNNHFHEDNNMDVFIEGNENIVSQASDAPPPTLVFNESNINSYKNTAELITNDNHTSDDLCSNDTLTINNTSCQEVTDLPISTIEPQIQTLPEVNDIMENIVENVENIEQEEEEIRLYSNVETIFPDEEIELNQVQQVNRNVDSSIIEPLGHSMTIPVTTTASSTSPMQIYPNSITLDSNSLIHSEDGLFYFDSASQNQPFPIQSLITEESEGEHNQELVEDYEMIHIEDPVDVSDPALTVPHAEDEEEDEEEDSKDNSKMTAEDIFKQITEFDPIKQKSRGKRKKRKVHTSTPRKSPRKSSTPTPVDLVGFNLPLEVKSALSSDEQTSPKVIDSPVSKIELDKMDLNQTAETNHKEIVSIDNRAESEIVVTSTNEDHHHQSDIELINFPSEISFEAHQHTTSTKEDEKDDNIEEKAEEHRKIEFEQHEESVEIIEPESEEIKSPEPEGESSVEFIEEHSIHISKVEIVEPDKNLKEEIKEIKAEPVEIEAVSTNSHASYDLVKDILGPEVETKHDDGKQDESKVLEPEKTVDTNENEVIEVLSPSQQQQNHSGNDENFCDSQVIEVIDPGMEMEDEEADEVILIEPNNQPNYEQVIHNYHSRNYHIDNEQHSNQLDPLIDDATINSDDPLLLLANVSMSQSPAATNQKFSTVETSEAKMNEDDDSGDNDDTSVNNGDTSGNNDDNDEDDDQTDEDDELLLNVSTSSTGNGSEHNSRCKNENNSNDPEMNEEMRSRARYYKRMQRLKKELEFQGRPRKEEVDDVVEVATRLSPPKVTPRVFKVGDIVWGKKEKFPNWPGRLVPVETCGDEEYEEQCNKSKDDNSKMLLVRWCGKSSRLQWVSEANLKTTSEGLDEHIRLNRRHRKASNNRVIDRDLDDAIQDAFSNPA